MKQLDLAARIAALSEEKRTLLTMRLKNKKGEFSQSITRQQEYDSSQLSLATQMKLIIEGGDTDVCQRTVNLESEAVVDPTVILTSKPLHWVNPATIFLTGATGFLGAFLLHELLQQTQAKVYCLVRASTEAEATSKLQWCLEHCGLWEPSLNDRILGICGDLSKPRLSLSEIQFQELVNCVDVIYHSGALVNFVYPYHALKPANVLGTQEILRLACLGQVKPVHYVSSLSVFGNERSPQASGFTEGDFPGPDANLNDGYSQSKWVAEQLMRIAKTRGVPVSIYRPATITGHSKTGVWNNNDFLCRLIKGCIQLGKAPEEESIFNMVPVDYVSRAIVFLSTRASSIGLTFHLTNPTPISSEDLIDWVNAWGYPIKRIPFSQWRKKMYEAAKCSPDYALLPLLPLFRDELPEQEEPLGSGMQRFGCRETLEALAGSGISCPAIDGDLLRVYFSYFVCSGFLQAPGTMGVALS